MKVVFLEEAKAEIRALPSRELQLECLQLLKRAGHRVFGIPLGPHPQTGDLTGCRKIYFGETSWRVVVRYHPSELAPSHVVVVAVGAREAMTVYHEAAARLLRGRD